MVTSHPSLLVISVISHWSQYLLYPIGYIPINRITWQILAAGCTMPNGLDHEKIPDGNCRISQWHIQKKMLAEIPPKWETLKYTRVYIIILYIYIYIKLQMYNNTSNNISICVRINIIYIYEYHNSPSISCSVTRRIPSWIPSPRWIPRQQPSEPHCPSCLASETGISWGYDGQISHVNMFWNSHVAI